MFARRILAALTATTLVSTAITPIAFANEQPADMNVTITAPEGVPAYAEFSSSAGEKIIVSKNAEDKQSTAALKNSEYTISTPDVVWRGNRYVASTTPTPVDTKVQKELNIQWNLAPGAQEFKVTNLESNQVSFQWNSDKAANFKLRRNAGEAAPKTISEGADIPVENTHASDSQVEAGATYSYTLFQDEEPAFSVTLGTPSAEAEISEAFIRDYSSTFLTSEPENIRATETGNIVIDWPNDIRLPLLDSGVVLPISDGLPSGYVGRVIAISTDGRSVELTPGGFGDVLAFMDVVSKDYPQNIPDQEISKDNTTAETPQSSDSRENARQVPSQNTKPAKKTSKPQKLPQTGSGIPLTCKGNNGSSEHTAKVEVHSLKPEVKTSFNHKFDKYKWLLPTELEVKTYAAITLTGKVDIEFSGSVTCDPFTLPSYETTKVLAGVPVGIVLKLNAQAKLEGKVTVDGLGFSTTRGVEARAVISSSGVNVSSKLINESTPFNPTVNGSGSVSFEISGDFSFGPGVSTKHAGALVGLNFNLVFARAIADITAKASLNGPASACASIRLEGEFTADLMIRAWVDFFAFKNNFEKKYNLRNDKWDIVPTFDVPKGCHTNKAEDVAKDVIGSGLTESNSTGIGAPGQWGRVDGFVKGQKTWVLSTGNIVDAVGTPNSHASTDLGRPGSVFLSELAKTTTYDAVVFRTTVVPTGKTLKLRYAFASEEYPEYVGMQYNDILTITVNGSHCAFVPGKTTPVSVNSINHMLNSQYYVDNTTGASGYSTSMDGLTVPLTCSAPVTPGKPAVVEISLADGGDGVLDSAVALLDKGIWSE